MNLLRRQPGHVWSDPQHVFLFGDRAPGFDQEPDRPRTFDSVSSEILFCALDLIFFAFFLVFFSFFFFWLPTNKNRQYLGTWCLGWRPGQRRSCRWTWSSTSDSFRCHSVYYRRDCPSLREKRRLHPWRPLCHRSWYWCLVDDCSTVWSLRRQKALQRLFLTHV